MCDQTNNSCNYYARDILEKDSMEYYLLSNTQKTVLNFTNRTKFNDKGKYLLRYINQRLKEGDIDGTIEIITIKQMNSGMWFNDEESIHYDKNNAKVVLTTYNNRRILGLIEPGGYHAFTSNIILYTDDWCFTENFSLYLLK